MKTQTISQHRFGPAPVAALLLIAGVQAAGAQNPKMPSCPQLEEASVEAFVDFLGQDRKGLSDACLEYAMRRLSFIDHPLSAAEASRAVDVLVPLLDFPSRMIDRLGNGMNTPFYIFPARTAIGAVAAANAGDAKIVQGVVARLIAVIADTTVSETVADNAAWTFVGIFDRGDPAGHLKAVGALIEAARKNPNAFSATRLREQARKLAQECRGSALRSQCDAAAN